MDKRPTEKSDKVNTSLASLDLTEPETTKQNNDDEVNTLSDSSDLTKPEPTEQEKIRIRLVTALLTYLAPMYNTDMIDRTNINISSVGDIKSDGVTFFWRFAPCDL